MIWFLVGGVLILILASLLNSYWEIGSKSLTRIRPAIFNSSLARLLQILWIGLLVAGVAMLLVANWIWGIIGAIAFWILLTPLATIILKRYMLPSWDKLPPDLKKSLHKKGYTEKNYSKRDWWKAKR